MVALPLLTWASSKFPNSHPNKLYTNAYSWSSLSKLQAAFACSSQRCSKLRFFSRNSIWVSRKRPDFLWVSRRLLVGGVLPLVMMLGGGEGGGGGSGSASARVNKSEIEEVLTDVEWPEKFPFKEEDFRRFDETSDSSFYSSPRFVTHIDDYAIKALTKFYSTLMPPSNTPGVSILDMCSSWVSHYPSGYKQERIVGMGMNEEELKRNPVLTDCVVQDLNVSPQLPFEDCSFDAITNVVSVDYLTKPIEVFKEMRRILKPGGLAIMSFSNRCFWTKAISIWTSTSDADHVRIVGSYFHYAGGFEPPQAVDISPNPGRSDPMYIVYSRKLSA